MPPLKKAWFNGWRIVARLVLLYLAMLVFWMPLQLAASLVPESAWRGWALLIGLVNFLIVLPIGTYYAAKWCREFKEDTE